mmetsp:Transcript_82709/g.233777  ORF Transcript_82709/g.233777 Transcript_82709/m.233777 type:complete len:387 (-) Transcript_82709:26-1186(-)
MATNTSVDDDLYDFYTAYLDNPDAVGMPCEFGVGTNPCPPRMYCDHAESIYECGDDCEAHQVDRCTCWEFYGHEGDMCDQVTGRSCVITVFFVIGSLVGLVPLYWHIKTVVPILTKVVKRQLKVNIAVTTLLLSTIAAVIVTVIMAGYIITALLIDFEMSFERYMFGPLLGALSIFAGPATLLVCTMWIDVASASMKKTKAQRAATKKKVDCAVIGFSVVAALVLCTLGLLEMRSAASAFNLIIFFGIGILYMHGGRKLSNMLAAEGKSTAEGWCGTFKTGTTPGMIVVNTAINVSLCCFSNIFFTLVFIFAPRPIDAFGVTMILVMIDLCLLVICLYLRFGLRKVLKIEFPMEKGSETTSLQTQKSLTKTSSNDEGGTAKVTPAK